jgi:2,3-bisphosphoglycerate-independent phosphoglycerate mutase
MTEYDKTILGTHIAYPQTKINNHFGEYVSSLGLKNFRVAETEKFNHVTFYFNALEDKTYPGEERVLIPSEKVATFDLAPDMRAPDIATAALEKIKSGEYDFGIIILANPDMLGHTGNFEAAVSGIETVDTAAGEIARGVLDAGGICIITADHGNAETMLYPGTNTVCTSHTTNPVPIIIMGAGDDITLKAPREGSLCDVAPTMLDLAGLEKPAEMTGESVIINN